MEAHWLVNKVAMNSKTFVCIGSGVDISELIFFYVSAFFLSDFMVI